MALQISLSAEQSGIGTPIPSAYARIVAIQWSVQDNKMAFAVEYHWNEAARRSSLRAIGGQAFQIENFDFSADQAVKKILYGYLKTLEVFAGAQDV